MISPLAHGGLAALAIALIAGPAALSFFAADTAKPKPSAELPPVVCNTAPLVGLSEVSDLINRLKPLAKDPDREWYANGVELTFYGKGVYIKLKQPNGNEYHGRANSLKEAVARLTTPSEEIRAALSGWVAP